MAVIMNIFKDLTIKIKVTKVNFFYFKKVVY